MVSTLEKAIHAKSASVEMAKASTDLKDRALERIAEVLLERKEEILEANAQDCRESKDKIGDSLYKRLELDEAKIDSIVEGVKSVVRLKDPVGETLYAMELEKDLEVYKVTVPIGVIGVVFESRPDALVQISCLCLKSGNAAILKGGSEAKHTNRMLYALIKTVTDDEGVPDGWVQLIESREEVAQMLKLEDQISLIIPRGSNEFVKHIRDNTKIPVLGHAAGICHVYVDREADLEKALRIAYDSKCQYPAVCNAMETLLIDRKIAKKFLPVVWGAYKAAGVSAKGDEEACRIVGDISAACESDWGTEYNDLILNVKIVDGIKEAVTWINRYGSGHTDAIVTEDEKTAKYFIGTVDSSSVMWNASTRFADGFRYGLGAEVGISTNKIHARGPVGVDGLVSHKWVLKGKGHVVGDFVKRKYTHKRLNRKWS
ncbi:MAG: glutamate-5-semialdehyde dehydrogenase [Candidatus Altiarchaeota archaeon]